MELDSRDIQLLTQAAIHKRPFKPADPVFTPPMKHSKARSTSHRDRHRAGNDSKSQTPSGLATKATSKGQPDPLKTAFGYIGADSYVLQKQETRQRRSANSTGSRRSVR